MSADELQRALDTPVTPARFNEFLGRLRAAGPAAAFECLFAVALHPRRYGHDQWASRLLVLLDPPCPLGLEQALAAVGAGELDLSNKLVPFYLAGQFGKAAVVEAAGRRPSAGGFAVGGVARWLSTPLAELIESDICWLSSWRMQAEPGAAPDPAM